MTKRITITATVPDDTDPSEVLDQMSVAFHDCFPLSAADMYGELHDLAVADAADPRPVVSTRDRKVRTGCTNNTVTDLVEIIEGYVADGYPLEDLVIEGVTE